MTVNLLMTADLPLIEIEDEENDISTHPSPDLKENKIKTPKDTPMTKHISKQSTRSSVHSIHSTHPIHSKQTHHSRRTRNGCAQAIKSKYIQAAILEDHDDPDKVLTAMRDKADAEISIGLWPGHPSYEVGDLLGRGAFGSVYEGRCRKTGKGVAIKRIDGLFSSKDVVRSSMREIELHVHVDRSGGRGSVARLIEVVQPDERDQKFDHMFSVFEKYENNLHQTFHNRKWRLVTFEEKRVIAFKIITCVAKLHGCGVAHRDIKPENIVLKNECYNVALCDLGMARMAQPIVTESRLTDYVTTRWYRAPEVCCGALSSACRYGGHDGMKAMLASDVWSLACVVGELLRDDNRPFFPGKSSVDQAELIGAAIGPMDDSIKYYDSYTKNFEVLHAMIEGSRPRAPAHSLANTHRLTSLRSLSRDGIPDSAIDLLGKMLMYDPMKRLTAMEALRHPFFDGLVPPETLAAAPEVKCQRESYTAERKDCQNVQARQKVKIAIHEINNKLMCIS